MKNTSFVHRSATLGQVVLSVMLWVASAGGVLAETDPSAMQARNRLVQRVRDAGADALPELIQALADERDAVHLSAAHLIARLAPPTREGLEAGLRHADVSVRRIIIQAMAEHGLLADYWHDIITDPSPVIRRETRLRLIDEHVRAMTGEARERVLAAFERAFREGSAETRMHVTELLAEWLEPGDEGWTILEQAVGDDKDEVAFRAAQLTVEPVLEQMRELAGRRAWNELVEAFAELQPGNWPDARMAAEAFRLRGTAYYQIKRGTEAQADLKQAVARIPGRPDLILLGHARRTLLDAPAQALEAYLQAVGDGGGVRTQLYSAILAGADILREKGRYDEALALLARADEDAISRSGERLTGRWGYDVNQAIGRVLIEQGRVAEVSEHFRDTLRLEGFSDGHRASMQKVVDDLQAQ